MTTTPNPKGVLNANYSENRAKKKELFFRYRIRATAVLEANRQYAPHSESIRLLDLGAADGKTLAFMAQSLPVKEALGVEYNQALIDCASDLLEPIPNCKVIQGDVTHLVGLEDASFDLVTALALLEHIRNPAEVIKEAARLLKPGGLFVASSPIPFWDHIAVKTGLLKEDHHECDMYPQKFRDFIQNQTNLKMMEYRRFMFSPTGILPYLGIQPSVNSAMAIDRFIHRLKIFDWLFVNQLVVAKKLA